MNRNKGKFIDANNLYDTIDRLDRIAGLESGVWVDDVLQAINTAPRCEVVPKNDYAALLEYKVKLINRLTHLLKSKFIRSFDEVISFGEHKGEYKRDIREADQIALSNDSKSGKRVCVAFTGGYKAEFNFAGGYDAFAELLYSTIKTKDNGTFIYLNDISINVDKILYVRKIGSVEGNDE